MAIRSMVIPNYPTQTHRTQHAHNEETCTLVFPQFDWIIMGCVIVRVRIGREGLNDRCDV